jgi:hypothetical protein
VRRSSGFRRTFRVCAARPPFYNIRGWRGFDVGELRAFFHALVAEPLRVEPSQTYARFADCIPHLTAGAGICVAVRGTDELLRFSLRV